MNLEQLNTEFGLDGALRFVPGQGALPMIEVDSGKARALISIYAGQVLSFMPRGQATDLLFLSEQAYFTPGKAIKGGVPVCWPWFGADPEGQGRPAHGFVRNRLWQVRSTDRTTDGGVLVELGLTDDADTRAIWPQAFDLVLRVTVDATLRLELVTRNRGTAPVVIGQALHTYFRIGDVERVRVLGLDGTSYLDKVDGGAAKLQSGPVTIAGEVDRIYTGVADELTIDDPALRRRIRISPGGSASAVVWNPWAEIASAMADLGDQDYRHLLCVETANAASDTVQIAAGGEHRLIAVYAIEAY